jgi:hypothetical protein
LTLLLLQTPRASIYSRGRLGAVVEQLVSLTLDNAYPDDDLGAICAGRGLQGTTGDG